MPKIIDDELLTREELAKKLKVSVTAVDKLLHSEPSLPCYRFGRRFLFRLSEILAFIRQTPKPSRGKS